MNKHYRCMSKKEAEADIRNRRGFADAPGGNAGAILCLLLGLLLPIYFGTIIYLVLAKIFGWPY